MKIENPQLTITTEEDRRLVNLNFGQTTIGRKSDNTVVISDPSVSGHHAVITVTEDSVTVEDLGSTNGTFVNQKRIKKPIELTDNTSISIGLSHVVFTVGGDLTKGTTLSGKLFDSTASGSTIMPDSTQIDDEKKPHRDGPDTKRAKAKSAKVVDAKIANLKEAASYKETQAAAAIQPHLEFLAEDKTVIKTKVLDKTVNPLGRLGVGVAAISYGRSGWMLSPVDGLTPMLNGDSVTTTAALLKAGDIIVLGDLQVRFVI